MEFITGTTGMSVKNYIGLGYTYAIIVAIWSCLCKNIGGRVNQGKFKL